MSEIRPAPQAAIDLAIRFEVKCLFAYDDKHFPPRPAKPGDRIDGTLTAGTGHTGDDVTIGMIVTDAMNDAWLVSDFTRAATRATRKIGQAVVDDLTDNQWGSVCDFVFCLGTGDPKKPEWTIWKRLRARAFDQVPLEMGKFVNWGTPPVKSAGLQRRRNAEEELWAEGEPGTVDHAPPASVTRAEPTPPTKADPVPASKSKALIIGAAGAVAGAGPMVNQVSQAIQPYAAQSHYIQQMLGILATVGGACAGLAIFFFWIQKRNAQN